jgi:hypothetical protein
MRRALLVCASITFALACTDNITEPIPERTTVAPAGAMPVSTPVAFATTTTEDGLSISTDKDDYQPGNTVHLTGSGWPANDVLAIRLDDEPATHAPHAWIINVGADGTFHDSTYVVDVGDLGVTFTLTATTTRADPERSLSVQFTDAELVTAELAGTVNDVTVTQGSTANFTVSLSATGAIQCAATLAAPATAKVHTEFSISAGGAVSSSTFSAAFSFFGGSPINAQNCTVTWTGAPTLYTTSASVSVASGTAVGDYVISLTPNSGNVLLTNQGGAGGKLADDFATTITVHVVAPVNQAPTANAGSDKSGNEGSPVQLDGSGSSDPDGDTPLSFEWNVVSPLTGFDPSASCSLDDNTLEKPSITCTDNGVVKVRLQVKDSKNLSSTNVDEVQVTINNVAPTAIFSAPSPVNEGSTFTLSLTSPSDPSTVDVSAGFKYAFDCGEGVGYSPPGTSSTANCPTTDNGPDRAVKGKIIDKDNSSTEYSASVKIENVAPTATFSAPAEVNEGTAIILSLTSPSDPSSADVSAGFRYAFDCGDGAGYGSATSYATAGTASTRSCPTADNGTRAVKGKIFDKDDGAAEYNASVLVKNVAPVVGPISINPNVVQVNSSVSLSSPFSDVGTGDTHTGVIEWDDGTTSPATISGTNGSGTATGSHSYTSAGVYTVKLSITDDDLGSGMATYEYVVVYDPSAGFVTGGGWISSPAGAYLADRGLTGKATFGFVSKYIFQKDKTTPVLGGNTEFQFHTGNLNFTSTSYDWLVVAGSSKATYKGVGSVNGAGGYGFLVSVIDESPDKFRIKIWQIGGSVIYDNQVTADTADDAEPTTSIAGGSIVIHVPKKTT